MEKIENIIAPNGRLWSDLKKKKKAKARVKREPVAVKVMKDGREICQDNAAGRREYELRTDKMVVRQRGFCQCGKHLRTAADGGYMIGEKATFGHDVPRGLGGGRRDDRIELPGGTPINHAECFDCNSAKGSRRTHDVYKPCQKRERA